MSNDGEEARAIFYARVAREPGSAETEQEQREAIERLAGEAGYAVQEPDVRIVRALQVAADFGMEDGDHHKMWVIDQMVRILTGCPTVERTSRFPDVNGNTYTYQGLGESDAYREFVARGRGGEWDEGIAP